MGKINADYLGDLVDACAAGDRDAAVRILLSHADTIKRYAGETIERAGGEV